MTPLEMTKNRRLYKLETSDSLRKALSSLGQPVFVVRDSDGKVTALDVSKPEGQLLASAPALLIGTLGDFLLPINARLPGVLLRRLYGQRHCISRDGHRIE